MLLVLLLLVSVAHDTSSELVTLSRCTDLSRQRPRLAQIYGIFSNGSVSGKNPIRLSAAAATAAVTAAVVVATAVVVVVPTAAVISAVTADDTVAVATAADQGVLIANNMLSELITLSSCTNLLRQRPTLTQKFGIFSNRAASNKSPIILSAAAVTAAAAAAAATAAVEFENLGSRSNLFFLNFLLQGN